jgi:hypothetical protein
MGKIKQKLESLGLLHDSAVLKLSWAPEEKRVELSIEDFYSNYEGQPEHPGKMSGSIILSEVQHLVIDIVYEEKYLIVYELQVDDSLTSSYRVTVTFRPSGRMDIVCGRLEIPELKILTS